VIVQRATVALLNAIFKQDFLNCSYGFRPGRSAHDALDEVGRVTCYGPTEYVLELDISSYFDSIVRKQLMEMVERICTVGSVRGGVGNGPAYSDIRDRLSSTRKRRSSRPNPQCAWSCGLLSCDCDRSLNVRRRTDEHYRRMLKWNQWGRAVSGASFGNRQPSPHPIDHVLGL
jgi:hypothetical protein